MIYTCAPSGEAVRAKAEPTTMKKPDIAIMIMDFTDMIHLLISLVPISSYNRI
jgi:hypothetical protein